MGCFHRRARSGPARLDLVVRVRYGTARNIFFNKQSFRVFQKYLKVLCLFAIIPPSHGSNNSVDQSTEDVSSSNLLAPFQTPWYPNGGALRDKYGLSRISPDKWKHNPWRIYSYRTEPHWNAPKDAKLMHSVFNQDCYILLTMKVMISMKESSSDLRPSLTWSSELMANRSFFSACRRATCAHKASVSATDFA